MCFIKNLIAGAAAASIGIPAAFADDGHPTMSMVSLLEVDPSKSEQYDSAWKTIRQIAMDNDYPYVEFVGGYRNQRWIVTPVHDFAQVDAVFAARKAVSDAGGKKYEKALKNFTASLTSTHSFFTMEDTELSYTPEGAMQGNYMEIDTFYFRYGAKDKMQKALADYKALMESKNSPYGYQVSWDGIGSIGNSVTIISNAENAIAHAEADAAINAMLEGDKVWEGIFADFLAINTGSETFRSNFNPEASMMPEPEE